MKKEDEYDPVHSLWTVADFVRVATDENIDRLLHDFRNHIQLLRHATEVLGASTQSKTDAFQWIDSGKHNVYINLGSNDWATESQVGRIETRLPAIFGQDRVIYKINNEGFTVIGRDGENWMEALRFKSSSGEPCLHDTFSEEESQ